MKVLNYIEGDVRGETEEVDVFSLRMALNLKPNGLFLVSTRGDEGYLFFKRSNGKTGCYLQRGTKTISAVLDSLVEATFNNLLENSSKSSLKKG
ncbi:hypothetical protein KJ603_00240 [Patescibacteria group bacterium]|nr:hypothetical protein [Patescibacteria group bacterium]